MTKQEYVERIVKKFDELFKDDIMCTNYEWGSLPYGIKKPLFNERYSAFYDYVVNTLGLNFGTNHHEHGIGNNNDMLIYKKGVDEDGFEIEKKVCSLHYVYGIYCHLVVASLYDNDENLLIKRGRI